MPIRFLLIILFFAGLLSSCQEDAWNDPYPTVDKSANIYYGSFNERPKTLDPARSYSSNESVFVAQVYEPPLQYHYLKEPYTLIPLTALAVPQPVFLDKEGHRLPNNTAPQEIAYTIYDIQIKPGIYYQPHPAFARNKNGNFYYQTIPDEILENLNTLSDFPQTGTRELTAEDYVYEIKRLADAKVQSPIFGLMSRYILGMPEFAKYLQEVREKNSKANVNYFLDLRAYDFPGVKLINRYTYRITLQGQYPQFIFWLAMPFFAPVPWEADRFYSLPGMAENNITFDWYPVGTGPYMLKVNNPNRQMVLARNPNFHGEYYPTEGMPKDAAKGLLANAGKLLPFIDQFVFTLERESIPRWVKFLQGYYDQSGITSDNFAQAISIDAYGRPYLTPPMQAKHIRLETSVSPAVYYMGFNMLDEVIGGYTEKARKLRQAISIGVDFEEFISIFLNGRGVIAQGPIPPGIFGYQAGKEGIDPYVYEWVNGRAKAKSLAEAQRLLTEAGYPGGRDAISGEQLILNFDVPSTGSPDDQARFTWLRKQFAKLNIQLQVQATLYNRFQEKMRSGNVQIFMWGWQADYPDPENFLFLLYGSNGKVKYSGENAANYSNSQFDVLYDQMKILPNGAERQQVISKMVALVRQDAPWVWGYHPEDYLLSHQWVSPTKLNTLANNTLKYQAIDPSLRAKMRLLWNRPIIWPLAILALIILLLLTPVFVKYWRMEHQPKQRGEFSK